MRSFIAACSAAAAAAVVPTWPATYVMAESTIVMPCNYSGWFDPTTPFAIQDYDWSNAKQMWANQQPMDCEERLLAQAAAVKAHNPNARVWVYRNLVKALPWFTSVRTKISDPAYSGWFLHFKPNGTYHVPTCDSNYDPPLCSDLYHDQDQTPGHPKGDGDCAQACDCGGVPCGEYLWDHRNDSLRDYLVNEFILGPTGLGNANVSGFYLDDGWTDSPASALRTSPSLGACDTSPIGGPTEEDYYCTADMGMKQVDTTAIMAAWEVTMQAVQDAIIGAGGFAWAYFNELDGSPSQSGCANWFRDFGPSYYDAALMMKFTNQRQRPLPAVPQDLATFLLIRGPYAWIGYGWGGCVDDFEYPPALAVDYGVPLTPYYNETVPGSSGVFVRTWSKANVSFDCNTWTGTVTPLA